VVLKKFASNRCVARFPNIRLYALLSPHIANCGAGKPAGWATTKAYPCSRQREDTALCLPRPRHGKKNVCWIRGLLDAGRICRSIFRWSGNTRAPDRNIAFLETIDLAACNGEFVLASASVDKLPRPASKLAPVCSKITPNFARLRGAVEQMQATAPAARRASAVNMISTAPRPRLLRTHESKDFLGGHHRQPPHSLGFNKGAEDLGGTTWFGPAIS